MPTTDGKIEMMRAILFAQVPHPTAESAEQDVEELMHDLQVHQIELEIQNLELRESHQALEESRDRYADLYDCAPVGYLTLDAKGCIREMNLTAAALLGKERSHLLGKPLIHSVVRRDLHRFQHHLRQSLQTRRKVTAEVRLTRNDGEAHPVQLYSAITETGQYRMVMMDISEYKRTEEALSWQTQEALRSNQTLREQTQLLQTLLDNMVDAVAVVDEQGNLLFINQMAEYIHQRVPLMGGNSPTTTAACGFYRDERGADYPSAELPLARALRGEPVYDATLFVRHPDWPQGLWLSATAQPLLNEQGALRGAMAMLRDITVGKSSPATAA